MKKIKRSISILLIAMMALAMLGGCGNNSTSGNSTADGDSTKIEKTADAGEAKGTESNPFILGVSPMSGWYAWYGVKDTGIFDKMVSMLTSSSSQYTVIP